MATYVTGDIHGAYDIAKLSSDIWPRGQELHRSDLLVICGDFGLVWSTPEPFENTYFLGWLDAMPWTTLFLDGNHENHAKLDAMEVSEWRGGKVHRLPCHPNIIHLMRGQVYDMGWDGLWFVMGGAMSHDLSHYGRTEGVNWWAREMPSEQEYAEARHNLDKIGWAVDFVFTHDCPWHLKRSAMQRKFDEERMSHDSLSDFLDEVDFRLNTQRMHTWYFGHYHDDLAMPDGRHALFYQQVVPLGGIPTLRELGYRACS